MSVGQMAFDNLVSLLTKKVIPCWVRVKQRIRSPFPWTHFRWISVRVLPAGGRVWYVSGALRRTYTLFYPTPYGIHKKYFKKFKKTNSHGPQNVNLNNYDDSSQVCKKVVATFCRMSFYWMSWRQNGPAFYYTMYWYVSTDASFPLQEFLRSAYKGFVPQDVPAAQSSQLSQTKAANSSNSNNTARWNY